MPRLTNHDYLVRRRILFDDWDLHDGEVLSELQSFEQHDLHRFFAPTVDLYDDDALAYRREVAKKDPGLAAQAGRAYAHFERELAVARERRAARAAAPARPARKQNNRSGWRKGARKIIVKPLVRPERDLKRIVKVLVDFAVEDEKRKL